MKKQLIKLLSALLLTLAVLSTTVISDSEFIESEIETYVDFNDNITKD